MCLVAQFVGLLRRGERESFPDWRLPFRGFGLRLESAFSSPPPPLLLRLSAERPVPPLAPLRCSASGGRAAPGGVAPKTKQSRRRRPRSLPHSFQKAAAATIHPPTTPHAYARSKDGSYTAASGSSAEQLRPCSPPSPPPPAKSSSEPAASNPSAHDHHTLTAQNDKAAIA